MMALIAIRLRRAISRDRRGVAAVEFAIIALVMVTLMLGAYDFGNAAQEQIALQAAVQAGGDFAQRYPTFPTQIQAAVTAALPAGYTLSAAPTVTCTCGAAATAYTCTAPPSTCVPPMLISVTATMPYVSIDPLFAAALPNNTASYVVRFQ